VRLLIDSHVAIWCVTGDARLSQTVRRRLAAVDRIYVSAASIWELAIKRGAGKLDVDLDLAIEAMDVEGFVELPITRRHGLTAGGLPALHGDPFDRLLVAQARDEGLFLVSADRKLRGYADLVEFF
jgi:PIN domain nuclease of toxin-antitoxin system